MTFIEFFQANIIMFILLAVAVAAIIVYELRNRGASGQTASPLQASQLVNNGAKLIDVRSSNDFKKGHIAGAQNIPAEQFAQKIDSNKFKAGQPIVLVDANGLSVRTQAKLLREKGYEEIYILSGGLATWQEENLPLVK